jgi:hypothetical protein
MKHILASALVLGLSCLAGCDNESTVSKEAKVETPGGSTSTKTETTIKTDGNNPPAPPALPGGTTTP